MIVPWDETRLLGTLLGTFLARVLALRLALGASVRGDPLLSPLGGLPVFPGDPALTWKGGESQVKSRISQIPLFQGVPLRGVDRVPEAGWEAWRCGGARVARAVGDPAV